jgi:hypothetical protein
MPSSNWLKSNFELLHRLDFKLNLKENLDFKPSDVLTCKRLLMSFIKSSCNISAIQAKNIWFQCKTFETSEIGDLL